MTYRIRQGSETIPIEPLGNGESIEEFYGYRTDGHPHAHTTTGISRSDVSALFLWEGPNGISLVFIHDTRFDGSGGAVTFDISGLDTAQGRWVVQDDSGDLVSSTDTSPDWTWADAHTDGGVWRGGLDEDVEITIDPAFNDSARKSPIDPGEITSWQVLSGSAENPDRHVLALDQPITITTRPDQLGATATTISFIAGLSENPETGGDVLNSTLVDTTGGMFPREFPADSGFLGDGVVELPDDLETFLNDEKEVRGLDRTYKRFRLKNSVAIEFDSVPEGRTLPSNLGGTVKVNTRLDEDEVIRVDGNSVTGNFDIELFDADDPEPLPRTILHEGKIDDVESPFVNFDGRVKPAQSYTRYVKVTTVELEKDGRPIEGVQVATLWGTSDPFTYELVNEGGGDLADWALPLPNNPVVFSWLELTVLADGTKLVRVPDASIFPNHAGYLAESVSRTHGEKLATSGLEVITDPNETSSEDGYDVAIRDTQNNVWDAFKGNYEEEATSAPYHTPHLVYLRSYRQSYDGPTGTGNAGLVELPLMVYGKDPDGRSLSRPAVLDLLSTGSRDWHPLTPFPVTLQESLRDDADSISGFGAAAGASAVGAAALWKARRRTESED